jgi:AcrR family transcriptional regulator
MWLNQWMDFPPHSHHDDGRKTRSDGEKSRERLLLAALALFSQRGFARTSTREIALAAGANVASISYYFGDKAGLYRTVFDELMPHDLRDLSRITAPGRDLRSALHDLFSTLLAPLREGATARQCMHMWLREMLEPTGVWQAHLDEMVEPAHAALTGLLARALDAPEATHDIGRLAICVVGLALQTAVQQDVIERLDPDTLASTSAVDDWIERLTDYALAMVEAERARLRRSQDRGGQPNRAAAAPKPGAGQDDSSAGAAAQAHVRPAAPAGTQADAGTRTKANAKADAKAKAGAKARSPSKTAVPKAAVSSPTIPRKNKT